MITKYEQTLLRYRLSKLQFQVSILEPNVSAISVSIGIGTTNFKREACGLVTVFHPFFIMVLLL